MPLFAKRSGSHKEMTDCKVKVVGEWKQALETLVKVNGKWKNVWSNETVFVLDKANASSATHTIEVDGINSTSNKITLENVRLVVRDDGYNKTTTYETFTPSYSGQSIEYKNSSGSAAARVTITLKPTNKVEFFIDILRNSVDRVEFAFSDIYKSG